MIKERTLMDASKERYLQVAMTNIKMFKKSLGGAEFTWGSFVSWFDSCRKPKLGFSAWRQNKAAVAYYLSEIGEVAFASKVESLSNEGYKPMSEATSANKKKGVSESELQAIRDFLMAEIKLDRYLSKQLSAFIEAIYVTGLRPSELYHSVLLDEHDGFETGPVLKVKNGKASNGRSFGDYRYLGLNELSAKQILFIKLALSYAKDRKDEFGKVLEQAVHYKRLSTKMYEVTKQLWPRKKKRPTLYSFRHQLIANLKHAGYTLVEIALVVGHGNDVTASEHYGRKRNGIHSSLPKPNMLDANKITKRFSAKMQKRMVKVITKQVR